MFFNFSSLEILVLLAISSFVFTIILQPYIVKLGNKLQLTDSPSPRKQKKKSLVRIGGIALVFGYFVSLLILFFLTDLNTLNKNNLLILSISSFSIFLLGLIDDFKSISPFIRLFIQILISLGVWKAGIRIETISITWINLPIIEINRLLSLFLTSIWLVGITNAINWIDGLDGLASGITGFAALGISTLAFQNGQLLGAYLSIILAGCCFGFLRLNFFPAKIMMGDGGSYFIGFNIALISLLTITTKINPLGLFAPILTLIIPIFDMSYVMYTRLSKGISPFLADRSHIHHRLIKLGFSELGSVVYLYGLTQLFTVIAICLGSADNGIYILFLLGSFFMSFFTFILAKKVL